MNVSGLIGVWVCSVGSRVHSLLLLHTSMVMLKGDIAVNREYQVFHVNFSFRQVPALIPFHSHLCHPGGPKLPATAYFLMLSPLLHWLICF